MEAYKVWVRRNRQWLASIESLANTLTWMLPERFASSELAPEAVSTAIGLVTLMNQYIVESAPKSMPPWIRTRPGADALGETKVPWPIFVSLMKELEVLVEMTAEHYRGHDGKWSIVAIVEAIKALLRLKIFQESGYKMLIEGGETENELDPASQPSYCDPHGRPRSSLQGKAMEALQRFGENVPAKPSWIQSRQANPQPKPEFSVIWKQPLARYFLAGEVALILRPLFYVLLIRRYGLKSWKPWLASLAMELSGQGILLLRDSLCKPSSSRGTPFESFSVLEKKEMKHRQFLLLFYLLRSPFFETYSRSQLRRVERVVEPLPLFGMLVNRGLMLLEGAQSIYSYTSAS